MRKVKFFFLMALPVILLSCKDGANRDNNNDRDNMDNMDNRDNMDNMDNRENRGTKQGADRDTLDQGSVIYIFGQPELLTPWESVLAEQKDLC